MELRPSPGHRLHRHRSVMIQSNMLDDRQSDPASVLLLMTGRNPVEAFEDPFPVFDRDSASVVPHAEVDLPFRRPMSRKLNALRSAVNDRIGDQIAQSLLEKLEISGKLQGITLLQNERDPGGLRRRPADLHHSAQNGRRLNRKKNN